MEREYRGYRDEYEDDARTVSKPGMVTGAAICWLIFAIESFCIAAFVFVIASVVLGVGNQNEKEQALLLMIAGAVYLVSFIVFLIMSIQAFRGKSPNLILSSVISLGFCFLLVSAQVASMFIELNNNNNPNDPKPPIALIVVCSFAFMLPCFLGGVFALIGMGKYRAWKKAQNQSYIDDAV